MRTCKLFWRGAARFAVFLVLTFVLMVLAASNTLGQPLQVSQSAGRVAPFRLVGFKDVVGIGFNERIGVAALIVDGGRSLTVIDERGVKNYSLNAAFLAGIKKADVLVGAGKVFVLAEGKIYSVGLDGSNFSLIFEDEKVSVVKVFRDYIYVGLGARGYILDYNGSIVSKVPPYLLVLDSWERVLALDREFLTFCVLSDDGKWVDTGLTLKDYVAYVKDFGDEVFAETGGGSLYLLNFGSRSKTFLHNGSANEYVVNVEAVDGKYYVFYSNGRVLVVAGGVERAVELGFRVSRVSRCGDVFYVIGTAGELYVVSRDLKPEFQSPVYVFDEDVGAVIPYASMREEHAMLVLLLGERGARVAWLGYRDYSIGGNVVLRSEALYVTDSFDVSVWVNPPRKAVFEVWVYDASLSELVAKFSGITSESGRGRLSVKLNISGVFRVFAYLPPDGYFLSKVVDLGEVELRPIPLKCTVSVDRGSVFEGEVVKVSLTIMDALSNEDVTDKLIGLDVVKLIYGSEEEATSLDVNSRVIELPAMRPGKYFVRLVSNATEIYGECLSEPVTVEVKAWFINAQVLAIFAVVGVGGVAGLAFIYYRYKSNVWVAIYKNVRKGVDDEGLVTRFREVLPVESIRKAYQISRDLIRVSEESKRINEALKAKGPLSELEKSTAYIARSADEAYKVYRKGELEQAMEAARLASEKLNSFSGLLSAVVDERLKNVKRRIEELESYIERLEELRARGAVSEKVYSSLRDEYSSRLERERRLYEYYMGLKKMVEEGSSVGEAA